MNRRSLLSSLSLSTIVVASMLMGGVVQSQLTGRPSVAVASEAPMRAPALRSTRAATAGGSIADAVDRVKNSVVLIEGSDSSGSGVVVDSLGDIITNNHVIDGQTMLKVTLPDGTAIRASVLGTDPNSDLAVIRAGFPAGKVTPAVLGDSDQARVGDAVFAIGSPFDQPFTVTSGIISALNRTSRSAFTGRPINGVLQTDAAVNPGNSGGPLFNANGEVIGINASIENPSGRFFVGIGFAIPSNTVQRYLPALVAGQPIPHGQLGVSVLPLDAVYAAELGTGVSRGLYVMNVQPGSSAAQAGLVAAAEQPDPNATSPGKGGDVIVSVNGTPVATFQDLARALDTADVGRNLAIVVVRKGQQVTLSATLQPWTQSLN